MNEAMAYHETDIKIRYEGQTNQIDANTFLVSLFGLTGTINEINRELNQLHGQDKKIQINIQGFSQGSFIVHLAIIDTLKDQLKSIFSGSHVSYTKELIETLVAILSLFKLKKEKPIKIEKLGSDTNITYQSGAQMTVTNITYNIYTKNESIGASVASAFQGLSEDAAVEGLEVIQNEESIFHASRQDFSVITTPAENQPETDNRKIETDANARLTVVRVSFEESLKWEFLYHGNKISARLVDPAFQAGINNGAPFRKGDVFTAELAITKIFDPTLNEFLNKSYEVKLVTKHIPRPTQEKLL